MNTLSKIVTLSLRAKLVLFFTIILLWLALANFILIYFFMGYVREYNTMMETITSTNSINNQLRIQLDDEIREVFFGKENFNSGSQYDLLDKMNQNLDQIEFADEEGLFTKEISNVRQSLTTTEEYIDKLGDEIKYNVPAEQRNITYEYITIATDLIERDVRELLHQTLKYSEQTKTNIVAKIQRDIISFAVVFVIAIILSFLFAWYISGNIVKPIHHLRRKANEIAKGDLTGDPITISSNNEIGELYRASNQMFNNLKEVILNVRDTGRLVSLSSEDIQKSIQKNQLVAGKVANLTQTISGDIHEQGELVKFSLSTFTDLAARYKEIVSNDSEMQGYVNQSNYSIEHGFLEIGNLSELMRRVLSLIEEVVHEFNDLSKTLTQMDNDTELMNHIISETEQLNILLHEEMPQHDNSYRKLTQHIEQIIEETSSLSRKTVESKSLVHYRITSINTQLRTIRNKLNDDHQIVQLRKIFDSLANHNAQMRASSMLEDLGEVSNQMDLTKSNLERIEEYTRNTSLKLMSVAAMEQLVSLEKVLEVSLKLGKQIKQMENKIKRFRV